MKHTNRAFFYDLYCKGQENSEFGAFCEEYGNHTEFPYIEAIINLLQRRVLDNSDLHAYDLFRNEGDLIAIPGKGDNAEIIQGSEVGLRLFCHAPNNKTLIYLNGYHHDRIEGDYNKHPNYAHKAPRIRQAVNGIIYAEKMGHIHLSPNGGYYEDHRFINLLHEIDLTDCLE